MKTPSWHIQVTAISRDIHRFPLWFHKSRSSRQVNRGTSYISTRTASYAFTRKSSRTGLFLFRSKSFKCGWMSYVWSPKRYNFRWSTMVGCCRKSCWNNERMSLRLSFNILDSWLKHQPLQNWCWILSGFSFTISLANPRKITPCLQVNLSRPAYNSRCLYYSLGNL